ncbi:hypothetical protein MASR2M78_21570 [Treponema sp.]
MEEGVPGVFKRIAEKEPPKIVEQYRAPMVMSPDTGVMAKVKGTRSATAMVAVKPGKAPAMMPNKMATVMKKKFCRVMMAAKASSRICIVI